MCGIAGVLSLDGSPVQRAAVERMITSQAHRGPDGSGCHIDGQIGLGHGRLSILDPTPAGAQPMARDRNVLIHNGEIYNYLELAAELRDLGEDIRTGTDTEVILAAYRVWGLDAVARFNGIFAFALWDADRQLLILARDPMGVKPLYMRRTGTSLAFASEVSALLAGRPVDHGDGWLPEPHLGAIRDFFVRGAIDHTGQTFVDGVTALPPGHLLVAERGSTRTVRYWAQPALADDDRAIVRGVDQQRDRDRVEEFRHLFDSSVRLQLRSDVPIGTCLSGGLDSSSIVTTVAELTSAAGNGRPHEQVPRLAFHARFPADGIDESAFAETIARQSGVRLVHRTPSGHPLLSAVLPVLRAQGEPYGGASINAQYAVMSAAHDEGLKVLLDGQGADELLGGYLHYLGLRPAGLIGSGDPAGALQELRAQVARGVTSPAGAIASMVRASLPDNAFEAVRSASNGRLGIRPGPALRGLARLDGMHDAPGTLLARHLWRKLTSESLPALLRYEDRNSMAFGIEARVPFLDVRLVEMAVRLPDRLRINRGVTKAILRLAMKGRLPEGVRERRDKLGFAAPQQAWLSRSRAEIGDLLRGGQVVERGWVAPAEVEERLANGFSERRANEHLWRLFITEAWLRLVWPDRTRAGATTWETGLASASR